MSTKELKLLSLRKFCNDLKGESLREQCLVNMVSGVAHPKQVPTAFVK